MNVFFVICCFGYLVAIFFVLIICMNRLKAIYDVLLTVVGIVFLKNKNSKTSEPEDTESEDSDKISFIQTKEGRG